MTVSVGNVGLLSTDLYIVLLGRPDIEYVQGALPNRIPDDILDGVRWIIFSAASTPFRQQSKNSEYHVGIVFRSNFAD